MNPLDIMVAEGVREVLEEDLGKPTYKKIEKEIHHMYGITVVQAAGDFAKLDLVMRKFFGRHASNIESKIFRKILSIKNNTRTEHTITIRNKAVAGVIFESYGDPAKKAILDLLASEPRSIPQAISKSNLPKASTYNRAKELIQDGLIAISGFARASDGRKVSRYMATLSKTIFEVGDEHISVDASIRAEFLRNSYVFNSIRVS